MPGAREAAALIAGVAERLRDLTPIARVIAADVKAAIDRRFQTATGPTGAAWAQHSPTTDRMRGVGGGFIGPQTEHRASRRRRGAGQLLLDTGRLRQSIAVETTRTGIVVGTNVAYARAQQFGNPRNRVFGGPIGPIPARPFLPIGTDGVSFSPPAELERIKERVQRWLLTGETG